MVNETACSKHAAFDDDCHDCQDATEQAIERDRIENYSGPWDISSEGVTVQELYDRAAEQKRKLR